MIKTIKNNWLHEFKNELKDINHVRIVSPFITDNMVRHLLELFSGNRLQVITRYNLNDFKKGVSSLKAIERLLNAKAEIKSVKDLHSKLYLFDKKSVIITSANFTNGGFFNNKEFGILSYESSTITESTNYFNNLWNIDTKLLDVNVTKDWKTQISNSKPTPRPKDNLPDYGASLTDKIIKNRRYFIKFFGKNEHRVLLNYNSKSEIENGCCHYALSFSRKSNDKRPRKYRTGDVVFMARMIHNNDYAIFGKGITIAHNDIRDIAGPNDQKHVPWIYDWPILIRVYNTIFIDSTMQNCPKMSELIEELDYDSFLRTSQKHSNGIENINPWNSLRQQADIWLSEAGAVWMEQKFAEAISINGKVSDSFINQFYNGIKIK